MLQWLYESTVPKEIRKNVPRGCWNCEILGICRDRTQRDEKGYWKCRGGCEVIRGKKKFDTRR